MAANTSFGNNTSIMNTTEEFDPYCIELFVGPLIWAVFSVACACVGVPASVWLLWVLIQRQRSSTASSNKVYMLNLTIMDLNYNVFKLPNVVNLFAWRDPHMYLVGSFLEMLNFNGRPLLMACSCVDCYMAVVHPIRYMNINQSRYREILCVVVWVLTLTFATLYLFVQRPIQEYLWIPLCTVAICTITFCDVVILRTLRKPDPSGRSDVHPQKQRALQTITNSFIMTLVSYLPMIVVHVLREAIPLGQQEVYCLFFIPSAIFSMLGSTILPLLHLRNLGCFNDLRVCECI